MKEGNRSFLELQFNEYSRIFRRLRIQNEPERIMGIIGKHGEKVREMTEKKYNGTIYTADIQNKKKLP